MECGLISTRLRDELLPSVGMRDVLVHEYLAAEVRRFVADITSARP